MDRARVSAIPDTSFAIAGGSALALPTPATTKAPTPSQILVFDFIAALSAFARPDCLAARRTIRCDNLSGQSQSADFEQFQCVAESLERMQIVIGNVLSADEVALVRETLAHATFEDGRETAGFAARLVKNNRQAANDRKIETVRKLVEERISRQRRVRAWPCGRRRSPR